MCNRFVLALATYFLLTQPYLLHANPYRFLAKCQPSGYLKGTTRIATPRTTQNVARLTNPTHNTVKRCSPQVTSSTQARMTLNSFSEGGAGGGPSECDGKYHPDSELVVALSTGWYNKGSRCSKNIRINGNRKLVLAKVVDECDSVNGCDSEQSYQPPCGNNIVNTSKAVWDSLGYSGDDVGMLRSYGLMPDN